MARDGLPSAAKVFADLPPPLPDDPSLRSAIRRLRGQDRRFIGVLDDDPTGSQAVHGVQVVTVVAEDAYEAALAGPAATCFALTNSRSLGARPAAGLTARAARGLIAAAGRLGGPIALVSRSDSTLRGHVVAEVDALAAVRPQIVGRAPDGVLFVPAFIEAGRLTAADVHWARTSAGLVPVSQTEFARDRVFGYAASDLRDFVAEKSGGAITADAVLTISLADIRIGGLPRIGAVLAAARAGTWIVVNATEYSDLELVAYAVLLAERTGQSFLFRTGPSFVRALCGLEPRPPLRGGELAPPPGRCRHGLIVVGSHVAQTTRQMAALRSASRVTSIELNVSSVIGGGRRAMTTAAIARRVIGALDRSDVLLYTSRVVVGGSSEQDDLAIGRAVSASLVSIVTHALAARPAWIIAKGGITSHDVALHGLGMRRELFPGLVSVFRPVDAAAEAIGMPYVVFPGNVGDDDALTRAAVMLSSAGGIG